MPVRIYLFGGFRLQSDAVSLPPIRSRIARSLFAYLITYRDRPHTRALLAGTFWPARPEAQARRHLSQALWEIRSVLRQLPSPQPYILVDGATLQFNDRASYWLDVAAFQEKSQQKDPPQGPHSLSRLDNALSLYTGDFLAGYYDEWAIIEREKLRDRYLNALEAATQAAKAQSLYEKALGYATRLTRADPLRETAYREAMRLCVLLNRPGEARQQYERCRRILQEELAVAPSPMTAALYETIVARAARPAGVPPPTLSQQDTPLPLVGRDPERAALVQAIEQILVPPGRATGGGIVIMEGEAGVGKTRLLRQMEEDARWRGAQVLWAQNHEQDAQIPYRALRRALAAALSPLRAGQLAAQGETPWLQRAARIVPELVEWITDLSPPPPPRPGDDAQQVSRALTQVLLALAQITPHVLIVDDLQWADAQTLAVLAQMAPRLADHQFLLVVSYRRTAARERPAVWDTVRNLDQSGRGRRLLLERLDDGATAQLIQQGIGAIADAPHFTARLYRQTGGNPLFVLETLRAMQEEGVLAQDEVGAWHVAGEGVPDGDEALPLSSRLQRVIAGRLAHLSPAGRDVLRAAAVLGDDIDLPTLAQAVPRPESEVFAALDQLLGRGVLAGETTYTFSHDQIRQVAYAHIPTEEQAAWHRRAAGALEQHHPDDVEALAHHFGQAHVPDKAIHYHRQAAEKATAIFAYAPAQYHYEAALKSAENSPLPRQETFTLLAGYEDILHVMGRRDRQRDILARMADLAQTDRQRLQMSHRQARYHFAIGDPAQAQTVARDGLALARDSGDRATEADLLQLLGEALYTQGQTGDAVPRVEAALALYRQLNDREKSAHARARLGTMLRRFGRYDDARRHLEAALARFRELENRKEEANALSLLGIVHAHQGDRALADACYRQALDVARAIGAGVITVRSLHNLATSNYYQGEISAALALFDETATAAREIDDKTQAALALSNAASIRSDLVGDDERASGEVEEALALAREAGARRVEGHCLGTMGEIARRRGNLDVARRYLEMALETLSRTEANWTPLQLRRTLALVHLEAGRAPAALELLEETETACRALGLAPLTCTVQSLRGEALLALARPGEALTATQAAVDALEPGVDQAYLVVFRHAQVLDALDRAGEARAAVERAYTMLMAELEGLSPAERAMSLERIPEHRAIVRAWQAQQPETVTVSLPHVDAPPGRALHADEWVEVTWTVAAPEDGAIQGKKARRQHRIRRLLREAAAQHAAPRVKDLAAALDVSRRTIKRDLAALRGRGHDVPTRGSR